MQLPGWMVRTKFGIFLLQLPVYAGAMLLVTFANHLLSGKKIDWSFAIVWGLGMAAANAWVPPTKWRPRLTFWE